MNSKKLFVYLLPLLMLLFLTGCTIRFGGGGSTPDQDYAGVWKSSDGGATWSRKVSFFSANGKAGSISGAKINYLVFDPQDYETLYLSTRDAGIFYTYSGSDKWQQFRQLNTGNIRRVTVDPVDKCNLYAVGGNRLFMSTDCGRFWRNPYFHPKSDVALTDVEVSLSNNDTIFVTTSAGEVIKSIDQGETWTTVYRLSRGSIEDLILDPHNNQAMYIATPKNGIFKSEDLGNTWLSLGEGLKSYAGSHEYKQLILDRDTPNALMLVSRFGLLRSWDRGESWEVISLIPAQRATNITAATIDDSDSSVIYYFTGNAMVKSLDGGQTWASQQMKFSGEVYNVMVHPNDPNILYVTVMAVSN